MKIYDTDDDINATRSRNVERSDEASSNIMSKLFKLNGSRKPERVYALSLFSGYKPFIDPDN